MKELNDSFANEKFFIISGLHEFSFAGSFAEIATLQNIATKFCNFFCMQTSTFASKKQLFTNKLACFVFAGFFAKTITLKDLLIKFAIDFRLQRPYFASVLQNVCKQKTTVLKAFTIVLFAALFAEIQN